MSKTIIIEHKKTMTYVDRNPGPGLGQALRCSVVKMLNTNLTPS
jgi:hypothetical protein